MNHTTRPSLLGVRLFHHCRHEILGLLLLAGAPAAVAQTTNWSVLGWNNLGMHCMDSDFSVFTILPPYNTIHAQVIMATNGHPRLVNDAGGIAVTYRAVADASSSINRTSVGKGNFWTYCPDLFPVTLAPDAGLPVPGPSYSMPGSNNTPRAMNIEAGRHWFAAYGIPITPYDDTQRKNPYPMMRLIASRQSTALATNDIVLPVSDEMDCRLCHGSGTQADAQPAAGWVWDPNPDRDYRLNILRKHDEARTGNPLYDQALATNGYNQAGLLATVLKDGRPILCAQCHLSEALPDTGFPGVPPLTAAIHGLHAAVKDPATGVLLDSEASRDACYRCHPGAVTRCLRGAMGNAIASNGTPSMQCQSCHGNMSRVGDPGRTGWIQEPTCQSCHVGTATNAYGVIRFLSVFTPGGTERKTADQTFATSSNAPAPNLSLYRFSRGHGGLYCEACHGSTHAEFPGSHANDNVYSRRQQGHAGVLAECASCHGSEPDTVTGGPHGLHPLGQSWVELHHDFAKEGNELRCRACHGADYRGTVLSRAHAERTLTANLDGTTIVRKTWRGYQIGCYTCHQGPSEGDATANKPPAVVNATASTGIDTPVTVGIQVTDTDGPSPVALRVVSQPADGTAALTGTTATYTPYTSFAGTNTFTVAAWDGALDSNLATVKVVVASGPCTAQVSPASLSVPEIGGIRTLQVSTGGTCPWTAAPNHRWLSILSSGGGSGSGTMRFAIERNTNAAARAGSLTVAGRPVTVSQAGTPPDLNGDGLPDTWQTLYFGSPASTNAAPGSNPDGDGAPNLLEYLSGTLPTDSNSVLIITALDAPAAQASEVAFSTVSNRMSVLDATEDLVTGYWVGIAAAVLGDGGIHSVQDPAASNLTHRFYRVRMYP
jgi:hypothetical protein